MQVLEPNPSRDWLSATWASPQQYHPPHLTGQQACLDGRNVSILIAMARTGEAQEMPDEFSLAELGRFCRRLGREANQEEVGLVVGDEYFAIRQFEEV